jgi:hypothetical protein
MRIRHPSPGIWQLLWLGCRTGELLEIALDAHVISAEVVRPLLARNQRSQRLLLGLLKWRRRQ